jgi:hypothetical protein
VPNALPPHPSRWCSKSQQHPAPAPTRGSGAQLRMAGSGLIGSRVRKWFEDPGDWFAGTVAGYDYRQKW